MNVEKTIKKALKETGKKQADLLEQLGYKSRSSLSDKIKRGSGMSVASFLQIMDAIGYEVVIRKKIPDGVEIKIEEE